MRTRGLRFVTRAELAAAAAAARPSRSLCPRVMPIWVQIVIASVIGSVFTLVVSESLRRGSSRQSGAWTPSAGMHSSDGAPHLRQPQYPFQHRLEMSGHHAAAPHPFAREEWEGAGRLGGLAAPVVQEEPRSPRFGGGLPVAAAEAAAPPVAAHPAALAAALPLTPIAVPLALAAEAPARAVPPPGDDGAGAPPLEQPAAPLAAAGVAGSLRKPPFEADAPAARVERGAAAPDAAVPDVAAPDVAAPDVAVRLLPAAPLAAAAQPHPAVTAAAPPPVAAPLPATAASGALQSEPPASGFILEPRASNSLVFAVRHMLRELPASWPITVLHGPGNRAFVHEHFAPEVRAGRVRTWEFYGVPDAGSGGAAPAHPRYSHELWNNTLAFARSESGEAAAPPRADFHCANVPTAVMTNLGLYATPGLIASERFLMFQTDGLVCGGQGARLAPLLRYDWVGAPWNMSERWYPGPTPGVGGNGGLSLRSRSASLRALQSAGASRTDGNDWMQGSEDLVFFREMKKTGATLPSAGVAGRFAVETRWDTTPTPLGFHATWRYHAGEELATFFDYCPAAEIAHQFYTDPRKAYSEELLEASKGPRHPVDVDATLPGAPE